LARFSSVRGSSTGIAKGTTPVPAVRAIHAATSAPTSVGSRDSHTGT
jgi:hypothetical protein